jgi:hypothetical protein
MATSKKEVKDFEAEVKTKKVRVKAKKEGKSLDVIVDTPNVDVSLIKTEDKQEFILDSKKLDVTVTKENDVITSTVQTDSKVLKKISTWLVYKMTKNFKKHD